MRKIKGMFITGTDTGVGKTYIAAGVAAELRLGGVDVGVMKPVETGCRMRSGRLVPEDALTLMKTTGVRDSLALVNPYRFRKPLAPSVAAALEGKQVNPRKILSAFRKLSQRHDFMIVEGAGGIMVPLSQRYLYLDLAADLGLPVVIAARPSLGTINHTLLTVSALRERGIAVAGVVINYAKNRHAGPAEKTSPAVIGQISGVRISGVIPHGSKEFTMIVDCLK